MEKEHDNTEARYEPIPVEVERKGKMVLDAAFKVHKELGPGLLESVYEACLVYEIRESGLSVASQYSLPIKYGGVQIDVFKTYRRPSRLFDKFQHRIIEKRYLSPGCLKKLRFSTTSTFVLSF